MTAFDVVTVLHDSAGDFERLLDSLDRHAPQAHVIAVDTGSTDGGAQLARDRGATVLDLPHNPGFGAANNAGVEHARHEVTALVNPDVELLDDGLHRLVAAAHDRDALHVPRLLDPDGSIQLTAHPAPGTAAEVARALLPHRLAPRPRRTGWAIAAVLVARTHTLRALGPFDPGAFLFYEDMDLCLRAPVPTLLHEDVALRHRGGHSTAKLDRLPLEAQRRREVIGERLGPGARRLDDLAQAITFARSAWLPRPRPRAQLRALRDARRRGG